MRPEDASKLTEITPLDPDACWKLIERVAASSHLNRAPRLRDFLFYVGTRSLKEGITDVHEQEIGSVVFGRQQHYDTSQDNIVRVSASELRKRIDAYFVSDGVNEPLRFQIPRGGYKPVFRSQEPPLKPAPVEDVAQPPAVMAPAVAVAAQSTEDRSRLPFFVAVGLCVVLAATCLFLWRQNSGLKMDLHPWQKNEALSSFWAGFLDSNQNTDIVTADTSFTYIQDVFGEYINGRYFDLHDYMNGAYVRGIQSAEMSADRRADLNMIVTRLNGSMGDLGVVLKIQALDPNSSKVFVKFAREYSADSIKRNNTILIGGRKSNPWGDLFVDQRNFMVDFKPKQVQAFISNAKPQSGEQTEYDVPVDPDSTAGYGVIAYLPNPSHTAKSLIIEGTNSQATNAAGEFITSEEAMESFREKFPGKHFTYFEILLKTTRLNDTPFKAEVIAYRIH